MRARWPDPNREPRRRRRQQAVGLLTLPLSVLPFVAYFSLTPEGQVLWARARLEFVQPSLPELTAVERAEVEHTFPDYRDRVVVLVYHGVGSAPDGESRQTMTPEDFGAHLAALRAAGVHTVTATDVARAMAGEQELPERAVMITFDDGRAEAMLWADPLLEQAGMRATMFVITHAASEPGVYYASWRELREYSRSGRWDIQSHTHDLHRLQRTATGAHLPALTSLDDGETVAEYEQRIGEDLHEASERIEEEIGRAPIAFAYPFGAHGTDRSNDPRIRATLRRALAEAGIVLAFEQDNQETVPLAGCGDAPLELRRIDVRDWTPVELAQRIAQALWVTDPDRSCPGTRGSAPG